VKDAIKKNLKELISHKSIIISDGTKKVTIPLPYLDLYRFKYGSPQQGAGQGPGTVGDILWQPGQQPGQGDQPGDQPGEHHYEAEVDLETVTRMMLENLALPWLEDKPAAKQIVSKSYQFTDRRKHGMPGNLDKRRSLLENVRRNAAKRQPGVHDLADADLRYRVPDVHQERASQAAVYLLMDWSGSMTTEKKFIAKAVCFWMVRFLRLKYQHVEIVFIAHDTEAEVVTEHDFFGKSEGGGTRCSSALTVALQEIPTRHPRARWNVYLFHFSDGDNEYADNAVYTSRMADLLQECTMCALGEIRWASAPMTPSSLLQALAQAPHPRLVTAVLRTTEDIHVALRAFLGAEVGTGHSASMPSGTRA
jgi:sporulation protein YhbH